MNKCELILAMIAGMFQAVFKGVKYRIYNNRVTVNYELTVFIPKRGTFRPLVESIAYRVSEHLSVFDKWLPDSFDISQWELIDGAEGDDIFLNNDNEDYLLYRIRIKIVKIEEKPAE